MFNCLNQRSYGIHGGKSKFKELMAYKQELVLGTLLNLCSHQVNLYDHGNNTDVPAYALIFCKESSFSSICVVATEAGDLVFLDTAPERGTSFPVQGITDGNFIQKHRIRCHDNGIFDMSWLSTTTKFVTASGDSSAKIWDIHRNMPLGVLKGHRATVKCVNTLEKHPFVMATSSRDGSVLVWDLRTKSTLRGDGPCEYKPVIQILDAHDDKGPTVKAKRRVQDSYRGTGQAVTNVLFPTWKTLITSGANDGSLKIWDIRNVCDATRTRKPGKNDSRMVEKINYSGCSSRSRGYSSIMLDSTKTRLYGNNLDSTIYEYDLAAGIENPNGRLPARSFHGASTSFSHFYVRMGLSSDGTYLTCGSDDKCAYIWNTMKPGTRIYPSYKLPSRNNVPIAKFSPVDDNTIVTCSDHCDVKVWKDIEVLYPNGMPQNVHVLEQIREWKRPDPKEEMREVNDDGVATEESSTLTSASILQSPERVNTTPRQNTTPRRTPTRRQRTTPRQNSASRRNLSRRQISTPTQDSNIRRWLQQKSTPTGSGPSTSTGPGPSTPSGSGPSTSTGPGPSTPSGSGPSTSNGPGPSTGSGPSMFTGPSTPSGSGHLTTSEPGPSTSFGEIPSTSYEPETPTAADASGPENRSPLEESTNKRKKVQRGLEFFFSPVPTTPPQSDVPKRKVPKRPSKESEPTEGEI